MTPCKIKTIQSTGRRVQVQTLVWMLHSDWLQRHTIALMRYIKLPPSPPLIFKMPQTSVQLAGLCTGSEWCGRYATTVKCNCNKLPPWVRQCYSGFFTIMANGEIIFSFGIYAIGCGLRRDITVDGPLLCCLMAAPVFQSVCALFDSCKWTYKR